MLVFAQKLKVPHGLDATLGIWYNTLEDKKVEL